MRKLTPAKFNTLEAICKYENGELEFEATVELFQHLVDTGMAWSLQGHYGRTAASLIECGHVTRK
jgi:hypothetical protein